MTKTIRYRFNHEVGENVEGCKILEKSIVAPPNEVERRRGIYDYLVEAQPAVIKATAASRQPAPTRASYTRSSPEEMGGPRIRRFPPR